VTASLTPIQVRYRRAKVLQELRRSAARALARLAQTEPGTDAHRQALQNCAAVLREHLLTEGTEQQRQALLQAFPSLHDPLSFPSDRRSMR
jgi:hypothetical protein